MGQAAVAFGMQRLASVVRLGIVLRGRGKQGASPYQDAHAGSNGQGRSDGGNNGRDHSGAVVPTHITVSAEPWPQLVILRYKDNQFPKKAPPKGRLCRYRCHYTAVKHTLATPWDGEAMRRKAP